MAYTFDKILAFDPTTRLWALNAEAQAYAWDDTEHITPLVVRVGGVETGTVSTSDVGVFETFEQDDHPRVRLVSGGFEWVVWSFDGILDALAGSATAAQEAQLAVEQFIAEHDGIDFPAGGEPGFYLGLDAGGQRVWMPAPTGVGGASITTYSAVASLPGYPASGFSEPGHRHETADLADLTNIGRALARASSDGAAREILKAAPSTVVSFPGFGSTAETAARGLHGHTATAVSVTPPAGMAATNLQDLVVELRALIAAGGGAGAVSETLNVRWTNAGGWPAQAPSPPAGVLYRVARGPVPPTYLPWTGVIDEYIVTPASELP